MEAIPLEEADTEEGNSLVLVPRKVYQKMLKSHQNLFRKKKVRRHTLANLRFDVDAGNIRSRSPLAYDGGVSPSGNGLVLQSNQTQRRESFLYRDSDIEASPKSTSRNSSLASEGYGEDLIVTPFAQILATLRNIRNNYISLTNVTPARNKRSSSTTGPQSFMPKNNLQYGDENYLRVAQETLEELDWCLDQLEAVQTHRSVSDMASSKFKRMLNKELSHFSESSKSGNQISEYICSTFLDKNQELDISSLRYEDDQTFVKKSVREASATMSQICGARKPLTHANSLTSDSVPKYGVETNHEKELHEVCPFFFRICQKNMQPGLPQNLSTVFGKPSEERAWY